MSLTTQRGILLVRSAIVQSKRTYKVNIQRPRKPHFEKALLLETTKPKFAKQPIPECLKDLKIYQNNVLENKLQQIYAKELLNRFDSSKLVVFYHFNPASSELQFKSYAAFKKQGMELKQYGKKTLELAIANTKYNDILKFYCSHNAMLFCPEVDLKKVIRLSKRYGHLVMLAALMDGQLITKDEILHYSTIPNLQTAQAGLVQTLSALGTTMVSHLNSHQQNLVGMLSERMKQLEVDDSGEKKDV